MIYAGNDGVEFRIEVRQAKLTRSRKYTKNQVKL